MITTKLFLIHDTRLLLSKFLLLLDHSVTDYELGSYPRARLLMLAHTLQRLAHCTHTTEPMASHSHSGGPTAFRQNRSTAMTLSRPLRPTPPLGSVLGGPVPTKGTNGHRRGKTKTVPNGDKKGPIQLRAHKAYVRLPDQGSARP